jgi:hypothetical protein
MPPLFMIALIIVLMLIEAPILLLHEWNHDYRPPALVSAMGLTGPVGAIFSDDTIEALSHEHSNHGSLRREGGSQRKSRPSAGDFP